MYYINHPVKGLQYKNKCPWPVNKVLLTIPTRTNFTEHEGHYLHNSAWLATTQPDLLFLGVHGG